MNNRDYITPESAKKVYNIFTELVQTGEPVKNVGHEIITPEGEHRHHELSASLIRDREGNPIGFRGTARDVSERIKAEEEKAKLEAQLQQAQRMEALGTLAGGIAHNFNNVLMGIQGRASLMMMDKDGSHRDFEHLKGIKEYVKNAEELTKDLLGFARGGKYEPRPIGLNELIKHENLMFGRTRKEITLQGKYNKDLWTVEVDQGQMRQVLMNLYVNAWQAMPGGGDIYVQTENVTVDEGYVKPYVVIPGRYVKISVTDTGVGMDEATREKIFDPFFTTQEMGTGTGLGLASVYGIVKNHGGFINVYSEKGVGTTFNIYLPASEKEVVEEKRPTGEVVKGEGTILFVDDEEMITDVGELLLEKLGYHVLTAKSGQEAIEVYGKNRDDIDLVILDMIMPGMGGGETYDRLKEIKPDIKVLLSSGYSINDQAREILGRGCNGFIQKPFSMSEISQRIREHLDKG
jgi:signal transduction histidine kinase/CheY-like chemotaxis protein